MSDDENEEMAAILSELLRAKRIARKQDAAFARGKRKSPPDHVRESRDMIMAMLEREWRRTENPIWVWRAIGGGAVGAGIGSPQFSLPAWCADYLRMAAHRIQALSEGRDWAEPICEIPDDPELPIRRMKRPRQIGPNAAMDSIPAALGLRKQGWNAFSIDAAAQARETDLLRMAQLLGSEPSKAAARRAFMNETGRKDKHSVRRLQVQTEQWLSARRVPKP